MSFRRLRLHHERNRDGVGHGRLRSELRMPQRERLNDVAIVKAIMVPIELMPFQQRSSALLPIILKRGRQASPSLAGKHEQHVRMLLLQHGHQPCAPLPRIGL